MLYNLSVKHDFSKTFNVFKRHYEHVPLEIFGKNPYTTLISTMLSSRTRDEVTLEASKRLFAKAPNLEQLGKLEIRSIAKLIYPVGFYKTKTRQLKLLSNIILKKFNGKIPNTREGLMTLAGVGRKTANLVINRAFGVSAIAVDTHVHRISNLLGWVKTSSPEQTERELIKILPKKYWKDTNRLFVSVGRQCPTKKKLEGFLKKNKLI